MECHLTKIRVFKPGQKVNYEGAIARNKSDQKVNILHSGRAEKKVLK